MYYRISPISILPKSSPITTCEIFLSEVDPEKELAAGRLFFLIEIGTRSPEDKKLIDLLIDDINFNFYQNEAFAFRDSGAAFNAEGILEKSLSQANLKLENFSKDNSINLAEKNFNVTVGLIYKNSVYFSVGGKNKAFAISRVKDDETSEFRLHDILKSSYGEADDSQGGDAIFSSIYSGTLPKNGYLVFTNEALSEYLSGKQMINIVTKLPPQGAALQIKNELEHINAYVSFLAIIIKNTMLAEAPRQVKVATKERSHSSIINLNNTERLTEKLLTPSGMAGFSWLGGIFGGLLLKKPDKLSGTKNKLIFAGERIVFKKTKGALAGLAAFAAGFGRNLHKYLFRAARRLKNPRSLGRSLFNRGARAKGAAIGLGSWFLKLKLAHKAALVIVLVSLGIFAWNIIFKTNQNKNSQLAAQLQSIVEQLEQKKNSIDSSLIYSQDRQQLKAQLDEYKTLLDSLPREIQQHPETFNKYLAVYEERMSKVRNVVDAAPEELASLSNIEPQSDPGWIFSDQGNIYAVDRNGGKVFKYQEGDKLLTKIFDGRGEQALDAFWDGGKIVIIYENDIIAVSSANGASTVIDSPFKPIIAGSLPSDIYNGRLYVLNRNTGQIQRFRKSQNSYISPENWLKTAADLKKADDISIDGRIYVSFSGGKILRFLSGNQENFNLDEIDPALAEPLKIKASRQTDNLYVLDSQNKRIVIFNKEGRFDQQYRSDTFANLRNFSLDETHNSIYILNGASIYKFELKKN